MASVTSIEINQPPTRLERLFEIIPGLTSWSFLLSLILLSFVAPVVAAYMIIGFDLLWLAKSFGMSRRMILGYSRLHRYEKYDWQGWLERLEDIDEALAYAKSVKKSRQAQWFEQILGHYYHSREHILKPSSVYNAVIIATYKESLDTIEPTVEAVLNSHYDPKKIILLMAHEERGGAEAKKNAEHIIRKFGGKFMYARAVEHPAGIPGEVIGKGGNITYAGKALAAWVEESGIDPNNVIVTTLDSDNRPHKNYFAYLTFVYCLLADRRYKSFQPVPMFYNNIWDAPAPMRLVAIGNSFWMVIQAMRPHLLRNFAAHSQSLAALIDTNFWSVRTIVEDGHQYWRTYFRYDGRHDAIPIFVPVYQDAVLAEGYLNTLKAQFIQVRRWAWGASDIAYVISHGLRNKKIALSDKIVKFLRLFEGHFSWATAPLVLGAAGWLPLLLSPQSDRDIIAHQLPIIASRIQMIATLGIVVSILLTLISLPPRPKHHKRRRALGMILQWLLIPFTGIFFGSLAAMTAQTRLMFGRYLNTFDFTEKAVHKAVRRYHKTP
jgi:cellulose synthase/poly-beta-1,6-N-acetylglucosamine synthase-like glycosyltransferase